MLKNDINTINDSLNNVVFIQDIIVASKMSKTPPYNPTGEFSNAALFGGNKPNDLESIEQTIERLYRAIAVIVDTAASEHRKRNYKFNQNELLPEKRNYTTRVITNEFFFYTATPLTLDQFQFLQQKIADLAKLQPDNMHLVLGSFAVLTPHGSVMNVVPHIECGANPRINFIIKNNESAIDPRYFINPNVDINRDTVDCAIVINGQSCSFTFDNTILCRTVGGAKYYSCIDICLDHLKGMAKNRLLQRLHADANKHLRETLPTQCSHVVLSNCTPLQTQNALGNITHADPKHSHYSCKKSVTHYKSSIGTKGSGYIGFGTPAYMYITNPVPCNILPEDLAIQAHRHNTFIELRNATETGNVNLARNILENCSSVNSKYNDGFTPLHIAISHGDIQMINLLIENGADLNLKIHHNDLTPIGHAMYLKNLEVVRILINNGVENAPVWANGPSFNEYYKQQFGHEFPSTAEQTQVITIMLLKNAILSGNVDMVKKILLNPNQFSINLNQLIDGSTLLRLAIKQRNVAITALLIQMGANPNLPDPNGTTPLALAFLTFDREIINLLRQNGVSDVPIYNNGPLLSDYYNQCEHFYAELSKLIRMQDLEELQKLLKNNFPLNGIFLEDSYTPLELAIHRDLSQIAKQLIEKGANPNQRNLDGTTPLGLAIQYQNAEMINVLLEGGAHMNTPVLRDGPLPMDYNRERYIEKQILQEKNKIQDNLMLLRIAIEEGNLDRVKHMVQQRGLLCERSPDGLTPLESAIKGGHAFIVKILIENDADPNQENLSSRSPLAQAISLNNDKIINILLDGGASNTTLIYPSDLLPIVFYKQSKNQHVSNNKGTQSENGLFGMASGNIDLSQQKIFYALSEKKILEKLIPSNIQSEFLYAVIYNNSIAVMSLLDNYPELLIIDLPEGVNAFKIASQQNNDMKELLLSFYKKIEESDFYLRDLVKFLPTWPSDEITQYKVSMKF